MKSMKHKVASYNSIFAQAAYNMHIDANPELFRDVLCITKSFCTFCVKRNYFYKVLEIATKYPEDVIQEAATFVLEWKCLPIAEQEEANTVIEFVHRIQNLFDFHTLHGGKRYTVLCCTDVNSNIDSDVNVIDIAMLAEKDLSDSDLEATKAIEDIDANVDVYNMQRMIGSCTVFIKPYVTPLEYTRLNKFITEIEYKSDTQINSLAVALESRRKAVDKEITRGRTRKQVDTFIYYESQRKPIGALL